MKRTIGLLTAVALSGAAYAQDVKVGGYIDGGFSWVKGGHNDATRTADSVFESNDYSITLSGNSGGSFGFIELGRTGAFSVGATQYYGGHKYDNGLSWRVGAFNGLLGAEDNESTNRYFINEGLVSSAFYQTYGGLHVAYAASDSLTVDFVVGNGQSDAGLKTNTGAAADVTTGVLIPAGRGLDPTMWAVKLSTKMDDVTAYVGSEIQSEAGETGYKIDVGAHAKMGQLHAGAEVAMVKAAVANADSGFGFGVHAGYDAMENVELLARFDWANDKFGTGTTDAKSEITVGPTFKLSDAFKVRGEWMMAKDGSGGDADQSIKIMGVYKF